MTISSAFLLDAGNILVYRVAQFHLFLESILLVERRTTAELYSIRNAVIGLGARLGQWDVSGDCSRRPSTV